MNAKTYFAVLDTETNWSDEVMSVGIAIADADSMEPADKKYYILTPECNAGGMYASVLHLKRVPVDLQGSRAAVMQQILSTLHTYRIEQIFAYNARFDFKHLPELQQFKWYDIMRLAAYRQYNKRIPENAECYGTGRLKRNYGVEPILRMLSGNQSYCEVHHALCDAVDELKIMKLLGYPAEQYASAQL